MALAAAFAGRGAAAARRRAGRVPRLRGERGDLRPVRQRRLLARGLAPARRQRSSCASGSAEGRSRAAPRFPPERPGTRRCRPRPSATPTPARSSATRGRRRVAVERILAGVASDRPVRRRPRAQARTRLRSSRRGARTASASRSWRWTCCGARASARERCRASCAPKPGTDGYDSRIGGLYHRWIEIYYADRGFVFSDPSSSINGVDARYIPFGSRALERPRGLTLTERETSGRLDYPLLKLPDATLRVRPAGGSR